MKRHPRVLVRSAARASISAAVSSALAGSLLIEQRLREVPWRKQERYVRRWARGLLRALGVEAHVHAESPWPRSASAPHPPGAIERPHLVVANHRSTLDIFLMLDLFGGHLLARGDMEHWPVVGGLAKLGGTLFVDRGDAASGAAAIRTLRDRLEKGRTIGVFPEGTTFAGDEVRPFHPGAFLAIARVRGEVTPVGIAYDGDHAIYGDEPIGAHFERILAAERTRVAVAIGAPFSTQGLPIAQVRDRAHAEVQILVQRAREAITR
jgi:1-acyl-sn-glycerol-3-phosphate acyltransferase